MMRFWGCMQGYNQKLDLPALRSLPTKTFSASRLFLHAHDFARIKVALDFAFSLF